MEVRELKGTKYKVSENGIVYVNNHILTEFKYEGIPHINLKKSNGKYIAKPVKHIVANTFFPLVDEDGEVFNLDNDVNNNYYKNLQWISFESDKAIDALDNDCVIIRVDNNTSYITTFYRGTTHAKIKTYQDSTSRNNYSLYKLSDVEIIDVNTSYMVFISKDKMCVARYEQDMMYKLMKILK